MWQTVHLSNYSDGSTIYNKISDENYTLQLRKKNGEKHYDCNIENGSRIYDR